MTRHSARAVHICSFSDGLDDMKRADQHFPKKVLNVLHKCGRFSVFEATANNTIAGVLTDLVECGYIEIDNSPGYPWSNVKVTPKGMAYAGITPPHKDITMREITEHKVNPANDQLRILVEDEPGAGGANHAYAVLLPDGRKVGIFFQNGPIAEAGVNGLTHEVLLAICIDRLRSFQKGQFTCRENALALTKLEEAQHWLLSRTRARMDRGVEGTHKV